jgi:hypothetical protein
MMNVAVLCVAFLCALNLFNPDAFIARQNIERIGLPDTVSLDTDYLYSLSDDAIPELAKAFDKGDEAVKIAVREIFIARKTKMEQKNEFFGQWQSWNYGREKAKEAYASVEEGGG